MNEEEVNQVLHFTSFSFIGQMGLFLNVTLFLETMQKFIYFMGENRIVVRLLDELLRIRMSIYGNYKENIQGEMMLKGKMRCSY